MTTITLNIPDEFARELDSFDLLEILKMGWVTYQTQQTLKTRKIIAPSRRVRPKRHKVDPQKWEQALLASSDFDALDSAVENETFAQSLNYVLNKNSELYRRLAQ